MEMLTEHEIRSKVKGGKGFLKGEEMKISCLLLERYR